MSDKPRRTMLIQANITCTGLLEYDIDAKEIRAIRPVKFLPDAFATAEQINQPLMEEATHHGAKMALLYLIAAASREIQTSMVVSSASRRSNEELDPQEIEKEIAEKRNEAIAKKLSDDGNDGGDLPN